LNKYHIILEIRFFIIYFILSIGLFLPVFQSNDPLAYHDISAIYRFEQLWRPFEYPWDSKFQLGYPNNAILGNAFYNILIYVLAITSNSIILSHKLLLVFLISISGYGFYRFFLYLSHSKSGSFFAGLFMISNSWTLYRITSGHNTILLAYVLLPYALLNYHQAFLNFSFKRIILSGGLSALIFAISPHMSYIFLIYLLFHCGYETIIRIFKRVNGKLYYPIMLFSIITAFTFFPTLFLLLNNLSLSIQTYAIRLEEVPAYSLQVANIVDILTIILGIVVIISNLRISHSKKNFFALLGLLGLILALGGYWPIRILYVWALINIPGFWIFRESYKFFLFPIISIAFFLSLSLENIHKSFSLKMKYFITPNLFIKIITLGLLIIITIATLPLSWQGVKTVSFPQYYIQLDDWLYSLNDDFRIAFFPPVTWATEYKWADHWFLDHLVSQQAKPTISVPSEIDLTLAGSFLRWIHSYIYENRTSSLGKLLGILGVKYVTFRLDAEMPKQRADLRNYGLNQTIKLIPNLTDLILENKLGDIIIYKNEHSLPHLYAAKKIALIVGDRRCLSSLSTLGFNFKENPAIFLENLKDFQELLENENFLIIEGNKYWDLILALAGEQYIFNPVNYAKISVDGLSYWVVGDLTWYWYDGSLSIAPNGYIMTGKSNNTFEMQFDTILNDSYAIFIAPYFTPDKTFGPISIQLNENEPKIIIPQSLKCLEGSYKWVKLGEFKLKEKGNKIKITTIGGAAAISKIAIVPVSLLTKIEKNIVNFMKKFPLETLILLDDYSWYITENSSFEGKIIRNPLATNGAMLVINKYGLSSDFFLPKEKYYDLILRLYSENEEDHNIITIMIDKYNYTLDFSNKKGFTNIEINNIFLSSGIHNISIKSEKKIMLDIAYLVSEKSIFDQTSSYLDLVYEKVSSSFYKLKPPKDAKYIVFLESYSDEWTLSTPIRKVKPIPVFGYGQIYKIDQEDMTSEYLSLTYSQYNNVFIIAPISFLATIILIIFVYIITRKKKNILNLN
jgi:hypothetical protein